MGTMLTARGVRRVAHLPVRHHGHEDRDEGHLVGSDHAPAGRVRRDGDLRRGARRGRPGPRDLLRIRARAELSLLQGQFSAVTSVL